MTRRFTTQRIQWTPTSLSGPRAARRPAWIDAYVPAELCGVEWRFSSEAAMALGDAQAAIEQAEQHASLVGLTTMARQLLRSESMASSQMEDVVVPGHRSLAKTDVGGRYRQSARAALANIDAVTAAYRWAATAEPWTPAVLTELHERIAAADPRLHAHAGVIRTEQNWVGTNPHTPAGAEFIPPPPAEVPRLLDDLCAFLDRTDLPPVAQAAIAHVQFETIHPFADGNGRVGRALIGATLIRSGTCREVVPPLSVALAGDKRGYVNALMAFRRGDGSDDDLYLLIAQACERAALASITLADQVRALQEQWRAAAKPRANSATALLVDVLASEPMLDVRRAATITGRSSEAARGALNALTDAGVLRQVTVGRRNRVWESVGLFALIDAMERELSGGVIGSAETHRDA